jgi:hypothetical protein
VFDDFTVLSSRPMSSTMFSSLPGALRFAVLPDSSHVHSDSDFVVALDGHHWLWLTELVVVVVVVAVVVR